ncbi:nuclear transport factor 2 family protein [Halorussus halobius]|uniref:nuclear transport factor 2 family protein n=1 Tax=Halorussus halobius TaxID=1710537 RepID=UPI001091D683|nr:nuclear transport factor 2 family protein [Halorussus halobius]
MTDSSEDAVRAYYDAIDAGDYEGFADLLAPGVVHERPDRTIEGRETLVEFMRGGRPQTGTAHEVGATYRNGEGSYAARGRLFDADGDLMFEFVDAFEVEDGRIERIRTYTR